MLTMHRPRRAAPCRRENSQQDLPNPVATQAAFMRGRFSRISRFDLETFLTSPFIFLPPISLQKKYYVYLYWYTIKLFEKISSGLFNLSSLSFINPLFFSAPREPDGIDIIPSFSINRHF